MINYNNLKNHLFSIINDEELNEISAPFINPRYIIFTNWYKAPFAFRVKVAVSTKINYWPDSMTQELWNPELNKMIKAVVFRKERVEAILNLRSFEQNYKKYGIPLKMYVVEEEDVKFFDRSNKVTKEKNFERELQKKLKEKLNLEKTKRLNNEISMKQNEFDELFSYLAYMANLYLQKEVFVYESFKKEFQKQNMDFKRFFFLNLMWIFMDDKAVLSKALKIDLSAAQVKNIYQNYLWDYTKDYFENGYKIIFDENTPKIQNRKLKQLIHKYSELLDDEILRTGLISINEEFKKDLIIDLNDLQLSNKIFEFNQDHNVVPTSKTIEKIDTKDPILNIENLTKGYAFYVKENIIAFRKELKSRK